jgi:hypothetical protein
LDSARARQRRKQCAPGIPETELMQLSPLLALS